MRLTHLVGFGLPGAFYAPAIARQLAGKASADEAAWFAARGATRGNLRLNAGGWRRGSLLLNLRDRNFLFLLLCRSDGAVRKRHFLDRFGLGRRFC